MFTYLFLPLPNDEAIALRWVDNRPFEEVRAFAEKQIATLKALEAQPEYQEFLQYYFPDGLPVFTESVALNLALNQGPQEAQKGMFLDMLDLGNPKSTGASGYGFYAAEIQEHTIKVNYLSQNDTVTVSCVLEDDNHRQDTLHCTVLFPLFLQGLEALYKKTTC